MAFLSSDVNAGDDILASHNNNLRKDVTDRLDQAVKIASAPTFATVNTGNGAVNCFAMNQDVETTDAVTFASVAVPATTRYLSVPACAFKSAIFDDLWELLESGKYLVNTESSPYLGKICHAPVYFPHGAIITSVKFYYFRNDAASNMEVWLYRKEATTSSSSMARITVNTTTDWADMEDTSITNDTIDNSQYSYYVALLINNNDSPGDCKYDKVIITYTITSPLP